jgi:hypothetical protein
MDKQLFDLPDTEIDPLDAENLSTREKAGDEHKWLLPAWWHLKAYPCERCDKMVVDIKPSTKTTVTLDIERAFKSKREPRGLRVTVMHKC